MGYPWNAGDQLTAADLNAVAHINVVSLVAGEALADKDAVAIGDGATTNVSAPAVNTQGALFSASAYVAFKLIAPTPIFKLVSVTASFNNSDGVSHFVQPIFTVYTDNAGAPSVTSLGTVTAASTNVSGTTSASITGTFASPISLTAGTTYWVVINDTLFQVGGKFKPDRASTNTHGDLLTSNTGGSWSALGADLCGGYSYLVNDIGKVYKASSTNNNYLKNAFIGFNKGSCSLGGTCTIVAGGLADFLTGLTTASVYYLNNTAGTIGTTPGANTREVGIALSATSLLITNIW